jgi:hypothetical protein
MNASARRRITYANVMSTIAVVLGLGGTAVAGFMVGTSQIKDSAVTSRKIKDGSVAGRDLNRNTITINGSNITDHSIAARKLTGTLPSEPPLGYARQTGGELAVPTDGIDVPVSDSTYTSVANRPTQVVLWATSGSTTCGSVPMLTLKDGSTPLASVMVTASTPGSTSTSPPIVIAPAATATEHTLTLSAGICTVMDGGFTPTPAPWSLADAGFYITAL